MTVTTRPAIAAGTYRIDPAQSRVTFTAKGLFGLETVRGTFDVCDGEIVVADDPARSTVRATLDAATFHTSSARRDAHVRSKRFLDAAGYPTMTFTGASPTPRPDGTWVLPGTLAVHGTTCDVPVTLTAIGATATGGRFSATARVDRYAAGVTGSRGLVGRYVEFALDVVATAG
jgi:polyisoprenoid-binding protein YceI